MMGLLLEFETIDLLYALIGIVFVFIVLFILILYVGIQAKVFSRRKKGNEGEKQKMPEALPSPVMITATVKADEDELVAVITAAIMVYYDGQDVHDVQNKTNTGFIVKRIKKI